MVDRKTDRALRVARRYADGGEVDQRSTLRRALDTGMDYAGRGLALADLYSGGMLSSAAGLSPFTTYGNVMEARGRALQGVPNDLKAMATEPINPLAMGMAMVPKIKAFHGSPKAFDRFDGAEHWFSTDAETARSFGKDRSGVTAPSVGGNATAWRDAKSHMYEVELPADKLKTVDPMVEARAIASQIGVDPPETWREAAELLQWGQAQKQWIDEARDAGYAGVVFKNVGDAPSGTLSDHIAVIDPDVVNILRRF